MLKNIWTCTKLHIYNANVKSVLLSLWIWDVKADKKCIPEDLDFHICLFETHLYHLWPEKIRNEELGQWGEQQPVGEQIVRRRMSWIGPTLRKAPNNITRQALRWNPQGKRKRGRPRNNWRLERSWTKSPSSSSLARVVDGQCSTWSDGSQ